MLFRSKVSLYLETYRGNGKRSKEYLGLYLVGNSRLDKEAIKVANAVRDKRQTEVNEGRFGFGQPDNRQTVSEYMKELAEDRVSHNRRKWLSTIRHIKISGLGDELMSSLTVTMCDDFKAYLMRLVKRAELRQGSAAGYFSVFRIALNQASRHGVIREPLHHRFTAIRATSRQREFLSLDEARLLMHSDFYEPYRSILLFILLTGLRSSEIRRLTWGRVEDTHKGSYISYYAPKTKKYKRRKLPQQARALIGKRKSGLLWPWIPSQHYVNQILREWIAEAGIKIGRAHV